MTDRLHVLIYGRVQGVAFRYATQSEAHRLHLCGWVTNRADGSVEACFEGPRKDLEQLLAWCRHGPPLASVTEVIEHWSQGDPQHNTFAIR